MTGNIFYFIKNILKNFKEKTIIGRLIDIFLLTQKSKFNDSSYAGEFEILNFLASSLNIKEGFAIDISASDGLSQSCTFGFFKKYGWSGLAVEMDQIKFSKLSFLYSSFSNVNLARIKVTPNNIKLVLDAFECPRNLSLLNLDIDSYDFYIMQSILKSGYLPKIISMEVNEKIPPGIFFAVHYDDSFCWLGDHFYGCSIEAACLLIKPYGYILYAMQYNNAIFIKKDLISDEFFDLTAETAYNVGYKYKENRKELFSWNSDVDHWMYLTTEECMNLIREHFQVYSNKYTLYKV